MLSSYFLNKNYTILYLHTFGDKIGNRLIEIFSGVFLYSLGMPLPFVLLFFGFEFGLRGLLAPLAPICVSRFGIKKSIILSYLFLVGFFILLGFGQTSLWVGFFSFIFRSFSRAIYYPCMDSLHSIFIQEGTRTKQYTLELVWSAIAGLLAVGIGLIVLTQTFIFSITALVLVFMLAITPLLYLDSVKTTAPVRFMGSFKYLSSPSFRENILPLSAQAVAIIANQIVVSLFIFIVVKQNTSSFTTTLIVGILIQACLTLLYGVWVDRKGYKKTLPIASFLQGVGNIGYVFARVIPTSLPILTGFNNTAWDMYSSNYNSRLQSKAQKSGEPFLFNTAIQMTLCFVEVVAFVIFALIAWQWGDAVFPVIFFCSVISLYISTKYFVD